MTPLAIPSAVVQFAAVAWSAIYWQRLRDWRFGLLTLMLALLAVRRILDVVVAADPSLVHRSLIDLTTLAVSLAGVGAASGLGHLVAQRNAAARNLRRERDLSDSIINSLPGVFYLYDEERKFLRWNRNFETVTGCSAAEVRQRHPLDFFRVEDRSLVAERIEQVFRTGSGEVEADFVSSNGQRMPYYFNGVRAEIHGHPCLIGMGIDVTERKRTEAALRESEERLRLFIEHAPAAIAMFDRDMRYLAASRRWLSDYRIGESSILGRSHYEIFPELPERWKEIHRRCLAGAVEKCQEDEFPRADGATDWVRWEIRPWRTAEGEVGGLILFSEVVTERKRAEAALREADIRLRLAARAANVGLWDWDLHTNRVFYSSEWKSQLGYADHEISDDFEEWRCRLHPDDLAPTLKTINDFVAHPTSGYTTEFRMCHRDGSYRWILTNASLLNGPDGRPHRILGCHIDITQRKRSEQALAESERRLRLILDSLQSFVGLLTPEGVLLDANRAAFDVGGMKREDAVGKPLVEAFWIAHSPHVQSRFADAIRRAAAGESVQFETQIRAADERLITIDCSLVPLRDATGKVTELVPSAIDITERNRAAEELRESGVRLAVLSRKLLTAQETERRSLARELHDEIGQVLTAVHISLQQIKGGCDSRALARLEQSVSIVGQAIQRVRDMSLNLRPAILDDFGLVAALRWYLDRQRQAGSLDIELKAETTGSELPVDASNAAFRIVQEALTNVQRHARATRVRVGLRESDDELVLTVADDGVGFDVAAARRRAMEAQSFGLLGMQERVELLGGKFTLDSSPGRGTRVHARLPLACTPTSFAGSDATDRTAEVGGPHR